MGFQPLKIYPMGRLLHRIARSCTYFVTTKTCGNRSLFLVTETADIVVETMLHYRKTGAYLVHEFVLMPDHLHLILTPGQTTTLEKAMQLIKGGSSYQIHKQRGHRMEIWQPGFHEWTVRNARDFQIKAEYIRMNPVEAKMVKSPEEWAYSSARGTFLLDEVPKYFAPEAKASLSRIAARRS